MSEIDFINAVLAEADCDLLLDVNNVFVNACNNGYDAFEFLASVPSHRVASLHVAGHFDEDDGFKIDTHGAPVKGVVWALLREAYMRVGVRPTLLERDFNFPPLAELLAEVAQIRQAQAEARWPVAMAESLATLQRWADHVRTLQRPHPMAWRRAGWRTAWHRQPGHPAGRQPAATATAAGHVALARHRHTHYAHHACQTRCSHGSRRVRGLAGSAGHAGTAGWAAELAHYEHAAVAAH
jgi:hypothetical protein